MKKNMKKYRLNLELQPKMIFVALFIIGFSVGMALAFIFKSDMAEGRYQWLNTSLLYLKYSNIRYSDILFYVIKKRCNVLLFCVLIYMTGKGGYLFPVGGGIAGGFAGFYVTEFICLKGILGSGLFFLTLFPHYLCYAYAYYTFTLRCIKGVVGKTTINRLGQCDCVKTLNNSSGIIKKYTPIIVVIIGIILECYVNPFFLKIFSNFFI